MSEQEEYVPPKVWEWDKDNGGRFANINRPIAGPTHDKDLKAALIIVLLRPRLLWLF